MNNESSRAGANDWEAAPGVANNDVQTSASIISQDIVNKDDSTTENILQPQTTQPALLIHMIMWKLSFQLQMMMNQANLLLQKRLLPKNHQVRQLNADGRKPFY